MKNILLLTSVYPANDFSKNTTSVVHYFARSWVSLGYDVRVVHNIKYYYGFVYLITGIFKNLISKYYKFTFSTKRNSNEKHYLLEKVSVYRLPIFRKFPFLPISKREQNKQLEKIIKLNVLIGFKPEVIIGHWANPQLYLVSELGKYYKVPTCMVIHSDVKTIGRLYSKRFNEIIGSIDVWGFRSREIKNRFENLYGDTKYSFICYSGIPVNKINPNLKTFKNGIKNFLFVGSLIPRKYPLVLIKAIYAVFKDVDFRINYIGEGRERKSILKLAKKLNISNKISLLGRLPRKEVFEMMKMSDCFIMVSKPETFGLVYLEAMSMGCISIGSKGEGIDGIIKQGINGFLSEAGSHKKLTELLKEVSSLSAKELCTISKNGIQTALELSEEKAAKHYIKSVKLIQENGAFNRF